MSDKKNETQKIKVEMVVFFLLVVVFLVVLLIFLYTRKAAKPIAVRLSVPQSTVPLPTGEQSFNVTYGDEINNKPKIADIKVDPLDPAPGTAQKISFKATSPLPLLQVASVIFTDTKKKALSFKLISGTTQDGQWSTLWQVDDTYNKTFKIIFHLVNESDVRDDEIAFR